MKKQTFHSARAQDGNMKIIKRFMINVCAITLCLACMLFIILVLAEWVAGCGETYTDSSGARHMNECLFVPQVKSMRGGKS